MANNESTIRLGGNRASNNSDTNLWKKVTFGTVTGVLLGAGALYAYDKLDNEGDASADGGEQPPVYGQAPVAHVSDHLSFSDAFAMARAQVGPGGVFSWHGGIYGTYYADEWDAMSDEMKASFAQSIHPEVTPKYIEVSVVNESHPDIVVTTEMTEEAHVTTEEAHVSTEEAHVTQTSFVSHEETDHLVSQVSMETSDDDDVHIVGQGEVDGHDAVALDLTGNDEADVVIIDVDDTDTLTDPDVVVFGDGSYTTVEEIVAEDTSVESNNMENTSCMQDPSMESPEATPDMPDYMDDAPVMI